MYNLNWLISSVMFLSAVISIIALKILVDFSLEMGFYLLIKNILNVTSSYAHCMWTERLCARWQSLLQSLLVTCGEKGELNMHADGDEWIDLNLSLTEMK